MRAAIFGATIDDIPKLLEYVRASSRLTHTDPKAEFGAVAVALAARESSQIDSVSAERWLELVSQSLPDEAQDFIGMLISAIASTRKNESTLTYAKSIGLGRGVSGYTYHTVPVAIHCWLTYPDDFQKAVTAAIECGGDADTTAAIVGGIVGARVGKDGIRTELISGIWEWPRSIRWMESLGTALAQAWPSPHASCAPSVNPITVVLRNLIFLAIVLCHGFRRIVPPYS
jgi:ADP-ribosylglycohydrolase